MPARATLVVCNCFRLLASGSCTLSLLFVVFSALSVHFPALSRHFSCSFEACFDFSSMQPDLRHARVGVELGSSHYRLEDRICHCLFETFFDHVQHLWYATVFVCTPPALARCHCILAVFYLFGPRLHVQHEWFAIAFICSPLAFARCRCILAVFRHFGLSP